MSNALKYCMELVLKLLDDKNLIPTLIGIAGGIIVCSMTYENLKFILKIGKIPYFILVLIIIFLFVRGMTDLFKNIKEKITEDKINKENKINQKKEIYEKLMNIIDKLDPYEKNLIHYLIENNNEEINVYANPFYKINNLLVSTHEISNGTETFFNIYDLKKDGKINKGYKYLKIKLKPAVYIELKNMKQENGSISHFK